LQNFAYLANLAATQLSLFLNPFAPGQSVAMPFRSSFQLVLLCLFFLAILTPGHTTESILGSDGNDMLFGTPSGDEIAGGGGNDILAGNDGDDVLRGGKGDDELRGGSGDDELLGGDGDDKLHGGNGNDELRGGNGNDELRGGSGNDELRGGNGDDVLDGGIGIDRLYGGLGADRFVFEIESMETDDVIDFNPAENDTVWLQRKYSDSRITAESIRVDREGDLEVQLANENWSNIVNLHQNNLEFDTEEFTDGLRLRFIKRF
jgi:Ca2+-binding RTX toxin-like protein